MKRFFFIIIRAVPRPLLIRLSYVFRWFAPLILFGNNVECNICGKHFRRFLPYGSLSRPRENVLCPNCLSLERHRLIWLYLVQKTDLFIHSKKMLHIAPEQCFYKRFKKITELDYITGDLESPIADMHFDLHDIPFEANTFDVVMCNHVLEHVKNDRQCMREIYRVLKPGGYAILQVPVNYDNPHTLEDPDITDPKERLLLYWQKDHVRLYGLDYPERLQEAGFVVTSVAYARKINSDKAKRWRLPLNEMLHICYKE